MSRNNTLSRESLVITSELQSKEIIKLREELAQTRFERDDYKVDADYKKQLLEQVIALLLKNDIGNDTTRINIIIEYIGTMEQNIYTNCIRNLNRGNIAIRPHIDPRIRLYSSYAHSPEYLMHEEEPHAEP